MKKIILSLFILSMFIVLPNNISAKTLGDLKKELKELEANINKANQDKTLTQEQINKTYSEIDSINKQITQIDTERKQIAVEIEELNKKIKEKDQEMKDIINFLQISNGESAYLEYAFGAQDFTDFIYRVAVSEQLTEYNDSLIKEYNDLIEQNNKKKDELNAKEKELENAQAQSKKNLAQLGSKLNEINDLKLDIEEEIKLQKEAIDLYENQLGCKDNEDIENCGRNYLPPGTAFYRPIVSGYITSEFGNRCYTLNGRWTCDFHSGIDMSAPSYAPPIYAAAPGLVALVFRNNCGGNQIFIQHNIKGVTYTTQYAHLLSVNVKKGDVVSTNTIIGYMGGNPSITTWDECSTGQHLHFSISKGIHPSSNANWWSAYIASQLNPRNYVNFPSGAYSSFNDRLIKYN